MGDDRQKVVADWQVAETVWSDCPRVPTSFGDGAVVEKLTPDR